jgi:creatinine amidohydrolase
MPEHVSRRPGEKRVLAHLTSAEAAERLAGNPVLLLPLGSLEDQGPHAPMGDFLCAERIAVMIAERAAAGGLDAIVAPTLPFGGRDFFGSRPGGIALEQDTLRLVLRDMLAPLLRHGVRRLLVVNGHGGNGTAIQAATQAVLLSHGLTVPCFHLWRTAGALLPGLFGPDGSGGAGHGADPLASVAMHLFPANCRPDLVPATQPGPDVVHGLSMTDFGLGAFDGPHGRVEVGLPQEAGPDVVTGDAARSGAERGARITEALVASGAALMARLVENGW